MLVCDVYPDFLNSGGMFLFDVTSGINQVISSHSLIGIWNIVNCGGVVSSVCFEVQRYWAVWVNVLKFLFVIWICDVFDLMIIHHSCSYLHCHQQWQKQKN